MKNILLAIYYAISIINWVTPKLIYLDHLLHIIKNKIEQLLENGGDDNANNN